MIGLSKIQSKLAIVILLAFHTLVDIFIYFIALEVYTVLPEGKRLDFKRMLFNYTTYVMVAPMMINVYRCFTCCSQSLD